MAKQKVKVEKSPSEFAQMSSSDIVAFIRDNRNTAIVGSEVGVDRHIIRYRDHEAWSGYVNPYSN